MEREELLMGTPWNIRVIRCSRKSVGIRVTDEGEVIVRAPLRMPQGELSGIIESKRNWIDKTLAKVQNRETAPKMTAAETEELAQQALKVIPPRVKAWAAKVGVTYGRITIRNQKTRWGSCSAKGNLNFNCALMLCPEEILDYVIVHELCHRKEMNHSKRFWGEVAKVMPDYEKRRRWLKTEGQEIISCLR